jgi:hypothetical protein
MFYLKFQSDKFLKTIFVCYMRLEGSKLRNLVYILTDFSFIDHLHV